MFSGIMYGELHLKVDETLIYEEQDESLLHGNKKRKRLLLTTACRWMWWRAEELTRWAELVAGGVKGRMWRYSVM